MGLADRFSFPHAFADEGLRHLALSHRSQSAECNDRLEWIGDSVLNLLLSRFLYENLPDLGSGRLSLMRSQLTSNSMLAEIALELGVPGAIRTNSKMPDLRSNPSVLADAVEALVGAAYLDGGYDAVQAAVLRMYGDRLGKGKLESLRKDAKTVLNELLQARGRPTAAYRMEEDGAQGGKSIFCSIGDEVISTGTGSNRAEAEQAAAANALEVLSNG